MIHRFAGVERIGHVGRRLDQYSGHEQVLQQVLSMCKLSINYPSC